MKALLLRKVLAQPVVEVVALPRMQTHLPRPNDALYHAARVLMALPRFLPVEELLDLVELGDLSVQVALADSTLFSSAAEAFAMA